MKKKFFLFLIPVAALAILLSALIFFFGQNHRFYLENNYYGDAKVYEIDPDILDELINQKESFALLIYQPACVTSSDFEDIVAKYVSEKSLYIYKIAFSELKNTPLGDKITYYPSFAIFHKGTLIDYLDANSNEDTDQYKNLSDFSTWFEEHVKIKQGSSSSSTTEDENYQDEDFSSISTENLADIKREAGKVNIYFFWGNGCPHCAEENKFFKSIESQYGKYYNLYRFETWYNDDNLALMKKFATAMNKEAKGVPYTIIGDQVFIGFPESAKTEMIDAIKKGANSDFDIYFDKIKPELEELEKSK